MFSHFSFCCTSSNPTAIIHHYKDQESNKINVYIEMNQGYFNSNTDYLFLSPAAMAPPSSLSSYKQLFCEYPIH